MKATAFVFAFAGVAVSASVSAAQDCGTAQTQGEMNRCAGRAWQAADDELNAKYQAIMSALSGRPEQAGLFKTSELAWLSFRDAECQFVSSGVAGGSIEPLIGFSCLERLTTARIQDFDRFLSCEEGDMSCPVSFR